MLQWKCLSQSCLSQSSTAEPLPQETGKPPVKTTSSNPGVLKGLHYGSNGDRTQFTSRPKHTQLKLTTFRPGSKHCAQQAKRTLAETGLKDKATRRQQQHMTHTGRTPRSIRSWGIDITLQGTAGPLLLKAITLQKRKHSFLSQGLS